jgi:hypothetical protein
VPGGAKPAAAAVAAFLLATAPLVSAPSTTVDGLYKTYQTHQSECELKQKKQKNRIKRVTQNLPDTKCWVRLKAIDAIRAATRLARAVIFVVVCGVVVACVAGWVPSSLHETVCDV